MEEIQAYYEQLMSEAAECDLIGNLAGDQNTRRNFQRQAEGPQARR